MAYGDWAHMDEERFRIMWGDEMEMFSYFSTEKVEDWWTKWGALLERGDDDEWECGCDDEDEGACPHGDEEGGGNRSADGHGKEGSGNWRRRRRVRGPVSPSVEEVNVSNGPSQTILSVR
ncbi:hypothetical protein K438DRAFT_1821660 [Mycena galopus ATCC 62051]|nr:hypothetical protein K438DRAFT_1821660 [Mycena galopus ATCC 62051]